MRWEIQERQSLYSHILAWIRNAAQLDQRIYAAVPAEHDGEVFSVPADLQLERRNALQKQQHQCHERCIVDGKCKKGLPAQLHELMVPTLHDRTVRSRTTARAMEDQHSVSVTRDLSLLINAHGNVVKVYNTNVSAYISKYVVKHEPAGYLDATKLPFEALFPNVDALVRDCALRLVHITPHSPNEVAVWACNIPSLSHSRGVIVYVECKPPKARLLTMFETLYAEPRASWSIKYAYRPDVTVRLDGVVTSLSGMAFKAYWSAFESVHMESVKKHAAFDVSRHAAAQAHQEAHPEAQPNPALCPVQEPAYSERYVGVDNMDHIILRRRPRQLVDFTIFNSATNPQVRRLDVLVSRNREAAVAPLPLQAWCCCLCT